MTSELEECIAAADARASSSWLRCVEELPSNPYGIGVRRSGSATLLHCHAIPWTTFNRIMYLDPAHAGDIPGLVGFFRERSSPVRVEMAPGQATPELLFEIDRRGFRPSGSESVLFLETQMETADVRSAASVRVVESSNLDDLVSIYEGAYRYRGRLPEGVLTFKLQSLTTRSANPFWSFYLAVLDGAVCGAGGMHLAAGVATLTDDYVVPAMRGRGVEHALISRRVGDARAKGCDVVIGRCRAGSSIESHLLQDGLRLAFRKVIWSDVWPDATLSTRASDRKASELYLG